LKFLDRFSKNTEIPFFKKVCPVGAKMFHAYGQTDIHTYNQTDRQTDRQTDTDRQAGRQTDRERERQTDRHDKANKMVLFKNGHKHCNMH